MSTYTDPMHDRSFWSEWKRRALDPYFAVAFVVGVAAAGWFYYPALFTDALPRRRWVLAAFTAAVSLKIAGFIWTSIMPHRRTKSGAPFQCGHCGYDLRGHSQINDATPLICSECGHDASFRTDVKSSTQCIVARTLLAELPGVILLFLEF